MITMWFREKQRVIAFFFLYLMYSQILFANRQRFSEDPIYHSVRTASSDMPIALGVDDLPKTDIVRSISDLGISTPFSPVSKHLPAKLSTARKFGPGPTQPEMQSFKSVNANNLVDLFTGDFSYNIPLIDVGGYPVNLHYQSGISMDQEASWVGLGWNINPGAINRNLRGLPDDFKGDRITKTLTIKKNKTLGISAGANVELVGLNIKGLGSGGITYGVFHNTYKGWGTEYGINASINAGVGSKGQLTGSLSLVNNSQNGFDVSPSMSVKMVNEEATARGSVSIGTNYNSRIGIQGLQLTAEARQNLISFKNQDLGSGFSSFISFATPSFTPSITLPITSKQFTYTGKLGLLYEVGHPNFFIRGYGSEQYIDAKDTSLSLPAFGYLYYQEAKADEKVLLDYNRGKEVVYHSKVPSIGIPSYTYDLYSITGEGTGGMFRPYRGDIGFIYDHSMSTKSNSNTITVDLGVPKIVHAGVDITKVYATTKNNPWNSENLMNKYISFQEQDSTYENVYFKNPGEKTVVNRKFNQAIGDDKLIRADLSPLNGQNSPVVFASKTVSQFQNSRKVSTTSFELNNVKKLQRDKRTQVITFLTADEASELAQDSIIKSYPINVFPNISCNTNYNKILRNEGFRKGYHISEITVLNNDARRYIYGLPVYNVEQNDVTFSVEKNTDDNGLSRYTPDVSNSTNNKEGKDNYFNKEKIPAYAHSFLLTGILSADYVDIKKDGITEDDFGDAIKFNYSQAYGSNNYYKWRAPFLKDTASYNEGLKTDKRDDKASYSYGLKEVWYLNSVESKSMVATFRLEDSIREDGFGVLTKNGGIDTDQKLYRLKEINLYTKSDFLKYGDSAKAIKTVHFEYDYSLCKNNPSSRDGKGKLTLKSVWFSYNGNKKGKKNPYVFSYHSTNPNYNIKANDRWGNYKNSADNYKSLSNADFPYAVQDSLKSASNAAAWTLNSIKLPSGGSIKVSYESDDYAYVQNKRAEQLFKIAGFGKDNISLTNSLYFDEKTDFLYVFVKLNDAVHSRNEIFQTYLEGIKKLYFKVLVQMPSDKWGSGYEFVPVFAEIDDYGIKANSNEKIIWIKLKDVNGKSPISQAAIRFLRLNLPSKAYPFSEPGDNVEIKDVVGMLLSVVGNVADIVNGFDNNARKAGKCKAIDTAASFIRLKTPTYKKFGGGLRVKRVEIYDNWQKMTNQQESVYGQEYNYTTIANIKGVEKVVSSGVASYEPVIGKEENPFFQPLEFTEKSSVFGPTNNAYIDTPLTEMFFPAPMVGYSKVTVQSIHKDKKSANGIEETEFYTTKDFPTLSEFTPLDNESRKSFNPIINKFLKFNAKNYVTLSQGFKVELNDMNGKMKSQASYSQTDLKKPISYTRNFYKVDNDSSLEKHLNNAVVTVDSSNGYLNTNAQIGKDIEIMVDVREQTSTTISGSAEVNVDFAEVVPFPRIYPSYIPIPTSETNRFRSIAIMKVVQRYGILDSVIHIEKGSLVSTKNMIYDGETGEVLLSRTNNEFNDPVYNFNYPAHWAYSGMGPAYQNIGMVSKRSYTIRNGRMYNSNLTPADVSKFESGDELYVDVLTPASLPVYNFPCVFAFVLAEKEYKSRLWVIDAAKGKERDRGLYLIDVNGKPFNGIIRNAKVIRSGKRNMASFSVGSLTSLKEPIAIIDGRKRLVFDSTIQVIQATANKFSDLWPVENIWQQEDSCAIEYIPDSKVLRPVASYLMRSNSNGTARVDSSMKIAAYYEDDKKGIFGRWTSSEARSLIKFDFDGIPTNAIINSASVNLYGTGLTPAINGGSNFSYEGGGERTEGYLLRYPFLYNGASQTAWYSSDYINQAAVAKAVLPFKAFSNLCADYTTINATALVQEIMMQPVDYRLMMLKFQRDGELKPGHSEIRYMSFCGVGVIPTNFHPPYGYPDTCESRPPDCTTCTPICLNINYSIPIERCYKVCRSVITQKDTINPYVFGMLGNWRANRSYTYYNKRKQSDPQQVTNVRYDGEINAFTSYWQFNQQSITENSDSSRWVWNTEENLFNQKGYQIENKDALNRYNAAQYGYNQTLPVAVTQNSKNRNAVFDGFEDYQYKTNHCVNCQPRWIDFKKGGGAVIDSVSHSGRYSLKIGGNSTATNIVPLTVDDSVIPSLSLEVDSIPQRITTRVVGNGQGLLTKYGVYLAGIGGINPCVGHYVGNTEWSTDSTYSNIDISWGSGNPSQICANNYFKVKWTGYIQPKITDLFTFYSRASDGLKVWITKNQVTRELTRNTVRHLVEHNSLIPTDTISLAAGELYFITVELTEKTGDAFAHLLWSSTTERTRVIVPQSQLYPPTINTPQIVSQTVLRDTTFCILLRHSKQNNVVLNKFAPLQGTKVLISAWVKQEKACNDGAPYNDSQLSLLFNNGNSTTLHFKPTGNIIEGWQRIEDTLTLPVGATQMSLKLEALSSSAVYFDDIRMHPFNANMKSFAYDPISLKLMAELDENNYASFYEYDDDGTLIRIKKETEKGVKTIQETRSALIKDEL